MAKSVRTAVLDLALNQIKNNDNRQVICSAQPTTYAELTTFKLAEVAMAAGDYTLANGDTSGRKVTMGAKSGDCRRDERDGDARRARRLGQFEPRSRDDVTSQAINVGGTVDIPAWKYEIQILRPDLIGGTPLDPAAAGYGSPLAASVQSNDSNAVSIGLFYKFMGATPDTTVTLPACAASTNSIAYTIEIWRGVDQTTPFAGVAVVSASGANTGLADPPSVSTPASPKGCVVGGYFGAAVAAASVFANAGATPYDTATNLFSSGVQNTATNRAVSGMGFKRGLAISTAFNAAITGSTTTNTGSWAALAFVLKPDATLAAASSLTDTFANDNLTAGTPDGYLQNALTTATVTGGALVIQPPNATAGSNYNGRTSPSYYSMRGQSIYAALTQAPVANGAGNVETLFGFMSDARGTIGVGAFVNDAGNLRLRRGMDSTDLATGTTFNSTNHFFLRLTHDDTTDHILLDGAPNSGGTPGTFTNIYNVARPVDIDVDCCQLFFSGGSFASIATPGAIKWDGLNTSLTAALVVAAANSSSVTDNVVLSPKTSLTVQSAASGSVTDSPTTSPKTTLAPAAAASAATTDTPTLLPKTSLILAAANSLGAAANVILTPRWVLTVAAAASSSTADPVTIAVRWALTIADVVSPSVADSPADVGHVVLTLANAASASIAGSVVLASGYVLAVDPVLSLSVADGLTITVRTALIVAAAGSISAADAVILVARTLLAPADAASLSAADTPTLSPRTTLSIGPANAASTADNVILAPKTTLAPSDAQSAGALDPVILTPRWLLAPDPLASTSANDNVVLASGAVLAPDPLVSTSIADTPALLLSYALAPANADSLSTAQSLAIAIRYILVPDPAVSASVLDDGVVSVAGTIGASPAISLATLDSPVLAPRTQLAPDPASSSSIASGLVLASTTGLAPADCSSLSILGSPALGARWALSVSPAASATTAAAVALSSSTGLIPGPAVSFTTADQVVLMPRMSLLPDDMASATVASTLALVAHVSGLAKLRLRIAA
jgi:hypothetical protein